MLARLHLATRKALFMVKLVLRVASRAVPAAKPSQRPVQDLALQYEQIIEALQSNDALALPRIAAEIPGLAFCADPVSGDPLLLTAIDLGTPAAVQWFLTHGALGAHADSRAPLTAAIERSLAPDEFADVSEDPLVILKILLAAGAPPNATDATGLRPLHIAAVLGAKDAATFLLAMGGDPTLPDTGLTRATPYQHALKANQPETAALLRPAP